MATTLSVLKHVCDILQTELGLTEGQVYLYNQKINVPPLSGLWIAVGVVSSRPYGSSRGIDAAGIEVQSLHVQTLMSIDATSQDASALERKDEILLALQGQHAQNEQVRLGFKIARLTMANVNLSEIEGAAIPYRFNLSLMLHHVVTRQKPVDTFVDNPNPTIRTEP